MPMVTPTSATTIDTTDAPMAILVPLLSCSEIEKQKCHNFFNDFSLVSLTGTDWLTKKGPPFKEYANMMQNADITSNIPILTKLHAYINCILMILFRGLV